MKKETFPAGYSPGLYFTLSDEEYFEDTALNSSLLKVALSGSPHEFWKGSRLNPEFQLTAKNEEMEFGTMMHKLIFEPDDFLSCYKISPGAHSDDPRLKTVYRHNYMRALDMLAELRSNKYVNSLTTGKGYSEVVVVWQDEATGMMCKAKHDRFKSYCSVDYKTAYSVADNDLRRLWAQRGYYIQGYHYMESRRQIRKLFKRLLADGCKIHELPVYSDDGFRDWKFIEDFLSIDDQSDGFFNVVQRNTTPFPFRFWQLSENSLDYGKVGVEAGMQQIYHWLQLYGANGEWAISLGKMEELDQRHGFITHN